MAPLDTDALIQILELTRSLSEHEELEPLLSAIVENGIQVLEADRGAIFLFSPDTEELYTLVATGEKEIRIPIATGIAGECARTRQVINVPDCHCDHRFNRQIDALTGYHTSSMLSIPLIGLQNTLIGVIQFINTAHGIFSKSDEKTATLYADQAAVVLQKMLLLDDRKAKLKMEHDLEIARAIQEQLLPSHIPEPERYEFAVYSKPSDLTGGDIYDVHCCRKHPNEIFLLLADATGHGIGPALAVTQLRSALHTGIHTGEPLNDLVPMINDQLISDLPDDRFITAFIGTLHLAENTLSYLSAGQAPLLHYCADTQHVCYMEATSSPLGIISISADEPQTVPLGMNDILVLLTDGFYEFENNRNEQFGKERVIALVKDHAHFSAEDLLDIITKSVSRFSNKSPQLDDMTAIILKRTA